jgi:1-acyl-sn-glycerol-3-phosphate acyltransferase
MKAERLAAFVRVFIHLVVLRPLVRIYCGVHVTGSAHLHDLPRFILIANHNSHLDVLLLYALLPARDIVRTHPVADELYFARHPLVFSLLNFLLQPVWIRRRQTGRHDDPLEEIRDRIERGHNIILFPEGTRGHPGEMQAFKSGLGRLVQQLPSVPIVPVFLSGPERVLPKGSLVPLPFWSQVLLGPPQLCIGSPRDTTKHLENTLIELSRSGVARRNPRKRRRLTLAPTLAVLGIDGSGKSTVSRLLAQRLSLQRSACLVSDRLEFYERGELKPLQPLGLEEARGMLSRYAKQAKSLASYKIPKLAELVLRDRLLANVNRWYAPQLIVQDGSPLLNMAAWVALYDRENLDDDTLVKAIAVLTGEKTGPSQNDPVFKQIPELTVLSRLGLTHLQLPRLLVLLDLPSEVACARITSRSRPRQPHETEEKLGRLREAYQRVVRITALKWNIPLMVVDGDRPLDESLAKVLNFAGANLEQEQNHEHKSAD